MSQDQIEILKRALKREKLSRKAAEKILEKKSRELYTISQKLQHLLIEKSSQLKGVFENIVDAYVVMDIQGNIIKFNDAATNLFGHDINKESINVKDLIYKEDKEYAMKSFAKLQSNGFFKDYEARVYTKSKEVKWVHINASLVFDKDKTPIAAQGIVRDITAVKYSEKLIEEQKKELNVIVDNSSLGIVLSQSGKIKKTNNAIQRELGYTEEELSKLNMQEIYFNDDRTEFEDYLMKMNSGVIDNFVINNKLKKKDGSILWARTSVNVVRDESGNIRYQVTLIEDITSEREKTFIIETINDMAKAILGKINIYEIAWEITNNIAKYLNSEDCVIYLVDHKNKLLEQIAAYGEKVDINNEIINKITIPIGKGIVGTVAKTGKAELIKNTILDDRYIEDGQKRFSEITVPIISDGIVIGIIDSEHEEKNFYNKKQLKTLERIADLVAMQFKSAINLRERLRFENKNQELLNQLGKSNDELHQYAHIVSHDLKSPLRSIDALLNWLKEDNKGKFDEKSLQNISLIETTLEKMELLISDVLNYSSLNNVKSQMSNVNTDIMVRELINILFIPEHIEIKINNILPIVRGDKTKLQQVFQNLICNAVKFSEKEKGIIEIDVIDKADSYQFSIRDNGIGIEEKYHEKIFKVFHFLKKSKSSSGIGLSIVKKIVNLHEGEIWLESDIDVGTTFYFTLKK